MSSLKVRLKTRIKWWLFPGLDLNTRTRYRFLPQFFRGGHIDTLDAGCGNGALAYAAYRMGNRVLGITIEPEQVQKARELFPMVGVPSSALSFEEWNLYDLPRLEHRFDQIICSETLEHIKQDGLIIQYFYDILRPGGILHLCCPYALHPQHNLGRLNGPEDGGHVRDGYTMESYRRLLEPVGFHIVRSTGLGTPLILHLDRIIRSIRNHLGDTVALPLFLLTWPLQRFDALDPQTPFSLYVQAEKPMPRLLH